MRRGLSMLASMPTNPVTPRNPANRRVSFCADAPISTVVGVAVLGPAVPSGGVAPLAGLGPVVPSVGVAPGRAGRRAGPLQSARPGPAGRAGATPTTAKFRRRLTSGRGVI